MALASTTGTEQLLLKERENSPAQASPEATALLEETPSLSPPTNQVTGQAGGRSVPQALPGRRINTTSSSSPPSQVEAAGGVPVRTGAAALQPLEVPWEQPQDPAATEVQDGQ